MCSGLVGAVRWRCFGPSRTRLIGFQNACMVPDQRFQAALVLVEEAAQDRSTPDPAPNRLGNR